MSGKLADYQDCIREAVLGFWAERAKALAKKNAAKKAEEAAAMARLEGVDELVETSGKLPKADVGNRGAVTGGLHLRGFEHLIRMITIANGLPGAEIMVGAQLVTLPGFFRPTKRWDVLVMNGNRLVAAFEFKSQVGSVGKNFNNRTEEAIGSAHCLSEAIKTGGLGDPSDQIFVGWLMLAESLESARIPAIAETDFPVCKVFQNTSYLDRYDIFCERLMMKRLYNAAAVIATSHARGSVDGSFSDVAQDRCDRKTPGAMASFGLSHFVSAFASHVAKEAANHRNPPFRWPRPSELASAEAEANEKAAAARKLLPKAPRPKNASPKKVASKKVAVQQALFETIAVKP